MSNVTRERRVVAAMHPSQEWKDRVKWMRADQVQAIYLRQRAAQAQKLLQEEEKLTNANLP